ncbi:hypothetical protein V8E54_005129 [Elaphomyces granulatus]
MNAFLDFVGVVNRQLQKRGDHRFVSVNSSGWIRSDTLSPDTSAGLLHLCRPSSGQSHLRLARVHARVLVLPEFERLTLGLRQVVSLPKPLDATSASFTNEQCFTSISENLPSCISRMSDLAVYTTTKRADFTNFPLRNQNHFLNLPYTMSALIDGSMCPG